MGCEQSTPVDTSKSGAAPPRKKGIGATERLINTELLKAGVDVITPKVNASGHLLQEEVVKRTQSSVTNTDVLLGNYEKGNLVHIKYAHWTQRGYYPDDPHKSNQDDHGITMDFGDETGDAFFAVYDGHGSMGQQAATFCKKSLPRFVACQLRQKRVKLHQTQLKEEGKSLRGSYKDSSMWPKLSISDYEIACRKGFIECNKAIRDDPKTNCTLSGTTAVSVGFHMGRITVCNVGDSRAILGHRVKEASASEGSPSEEEKYEVRSVENSLATEDEKHGTVIAVALTKDQTPYRKDERERVKKAGAVVCTIDQLEGTEPMHEDWCGADDNAVDLSGDPPRVWEKGKEYPGTAFTRSLGDSVADNCGVIAEPEMLTVELTANDEYMIIASDGVFEFLPNQYVVDLCVASKDPLEACDKIIRASYEQWLKYENRTDDITCIVLFLQCENKVDEVNIAGSTETLIGKEVKTDFKPLRLDNRERDTGGSLRYTNAEKAGLLQKLEAAPERRVQSVLKL